MPRQFVKISEQDLQIAEAFFENEKHFNEFLINVFNYYRGRNVQIKTKIVQKYFNSYKKVMDYIIDAAENGKEGVLKRLENQRVKSSTLEGVLDNPSREYQDTHQANSKVEIVKNKGKEKVHTLLPAADHSIPQSDVDRFNHYSSWAAENAPKLLKIKKPLTAKQFVDIRSRYSLEQFKEVCLAMEAKKDFLSKYDNLNLTMQSWLKRQFGAGGNSEPPPKVPLQKGIEMPKLITPTVNFEDAI